MATHVEKTSGHQNHHQHQRENDQEIADPHHGSLEMRNTSRACDQFRRASKKRVRAGGSNYRRHFALFNDRARVRVLARFLAHRQRFSRERGLIDADVIARDECAISRNNVAEIQSNNVSRHQRARVDLLPTSVAQRAGF
ncbi:MAG: hypothetical protein Udaeo_06330 [Candidatus Udaeobacter sp.]|nr:MAG: hypothetical protein Udaeo_06330 [Candidatus Udaeobacter sp.]